MITDLELSEPLLCKVINGPKARFRSPKNVVYIGRAYGRHMLNTPPRRAGWLGNPFVVDEYALHNDDPCACTSVEVALQKFRFYFARKLQTDDKFSCEVKKLVGKQLNCFCAPNPCHGDIIAEYVNAGCPEDWK